MASNLYNVLVHVTKKDAHGGAGGRRRERHPRMEEEEEEEEPSYIQPVDSSDSTGESDAGDVSRKGEITGS